MKEIGVRPIPRIGNRSFRPPLETQRNETGSADPALSSQSAGLPQKEYGMRETRSISAADATDEILEQRRFPRTREYGPQQLEVVFLSVEGQREKTTATLWDFGEGGLGMESTRPFAPGEELGIAGELHGPDYSMRMESRARVAYCRPIDAETFRVGVAFVEVSYRRLSRGGE
jgi:hypothetical protein